MSRTVSLPACPPAARYDTRPASGPTARRTTSLLPCPAICKVSKFTASSRTASVDPSHRRPPTTPLNADRGCHSSLVLLVCPASRRGARLAVAALELAADRDRRLVFAAI